MSDGFIAAVNPDVLARRPGIVLGGFIAAVNRLGVIGGRAAG